MKTLTVPGFYESEHFYANLRKLQTDLRIENLTNYPENSLGFALAEFLHQQHLNSSATLEQSDIFHVLTHIGSSAEEQVGLQFYLIGNGKKTPLTLLSAIFGSIFFLHRLPQFFGQFQKGKRALLFHHLEFTKMLAQPLEKIRETFLIQPS